MKTLTNTTIYLLAGAVLALASSLSGVAQSTDGPVTYVSDPGAGSVTVNGSSSLHDWSVDSQTIEGSVVFKAETPSSLVENNKLTFDLDQAGVEIPVKSLSGEKDGLNQKMYKAMEAETYPDITYELDNVALDRRPAQNKVRLQSEGTLTIHGTSRTLNMPMEVTRNGSRLVAEGETDLKMTDFDIEQPTALGGLVTAYDNVTVTWTWPVVRQYTPQYQAGSIMRETTSVFIERYDSARSALADGQLDRAKRSLEQVARGVDRVKLSYTDLNERQQSEAQPLLDQLKTSVDQAKEAENLESLRKQFKAVSLSLKNVVAAFGHEREEPVRWIQCAAEPDTDHRWIGTSADAGCPYLSEDQREEPAGFTIGLMSGSPSEK
jgi:polyisoprenoid-binding protein YceI